MELAKVYLLKYVLNYNYVCALYLTRMSLSLGPPAQPQSISHVVSSRELDCFERGDLLLIIVYRAWVHPLTPPIGVPRGL